MASEYTICCVVCISPGSHRQQHGGLTYANLQIGLSAVWTRFMETCWPCGVLFIHFEGLLTRGVRLGHLNAIGVCASIINIEFINLYSRIDYIRLIVCNFKIILIQYMGFRIKCK